MRRIVELVVVGLLAAGTAHGQAAAPKLPDMDRVVPSLDGHVLYTTYCAVCHGVRGDGGGPMAPALKSGVPDLTKIAARNAGVFPMLRVQKIVDGTEPSGLSHGTREMPVWGPIFSLDISDRDYGKLRTYNVAKYLVTLQRKP